jgi:hypothetical protein
MTEVTDLPQTSQTDTAPALCAKDQCNCEGQCAASPPVEATDATKPEEQVDPNLRQIIIRVPQHVTDQMVDMALGLGSMAIECLGANGMMIYFPTVQKDDKGQLHQAIGQARVPLLNPADIQRVLKVCQAITDANLAQMRAAKSGVQGATVNAAIEGEMHKDNVSRDEAAKAHGQAGGIIVAQ